MKKTKALLIGVSDYTDISAPSLPLCKNDLHSMNKALIEGLMLCRSDIIVYGDNNIVTINDFENSLKQMNECIESEDTFIFYFTGHGMKNNTENYLVFSDSYININEIIKKLLNINAKNYLVIIDSCYAGNTNLPLSVPIDLNETISKFIGHGIAVMASCGSNETSSFDKSRGISLYTSFVCDAFTNKYLVIKGKKSLADIKQYVDRLAEISNQKGINKEQNIVFRSNIIGTIYFDIENYIQYNVSKIYEEKQKYIIYDVKPLHANIKRLAVRVILRFPCTKEEIADITKEISKDAQFYDVYLNKKQESRLKGKNVNIIWCYFGYDENDIINCNYVYQSTWVDNSQNKQYWYKSSNNSEIINGIMVNEKLDYNFWKKNIIENTSVNNENLVKRTHEIFKKLIKQADSFVSLFYEYQNKVITEIELIELVSPIYIEMRKLIYAEQELPIASKELYDWQQSYSNLASTISDFLLYYTKGNKWDSLNRIKLTEISIKRYNEELEIIKRKESTLNI